MVGFLRRLSPAVELHPIPNSTSCTSLRYLYLAFPTVFSPFFLNTETTIFVSPFALSFVHPSFSVRQLFGLITIAKMGCAMSRKTTSTTTINSHTTTLPQWGINRYSSSTSSCSSEFVDYISPPLPRSSPTLSQGSTRLIKPERAYSPIDSPPQGYTPRKVPLEDKASSALSGINSLFRSKKVYCSGELTEIPLSNTPHTVLNTSGNGTPLSAQRAEKRWKPTTPPGKSVTNPKRSKKNTGAQSTSSPTESKLEIVRNRITLYLHPTSSANNLI